MDPLTGLRMTYYLVLFGIDIAQVPSTVRHSLELVRTCYQDAQHLIELRQTYLSLLEKRPIVLERVNSIIAAATAGLAEVCAIVEKCRPEAHNGKTRFRNRLEWIFVDEKEFHAQESMISRHHASVLAEMNFLRQIALLAPVVDEKSDDGGKKKESRLFDNVALFGDLLGGTSSGNPQVLSAQMARGQAGRKFHVRRPIRSIQKRLYLLQQVLPPRNLKRTTLLCLHTWYLLKLSTQLFRPWHM
ncbi:hypothetical protein B0J13DRAFT_679227 [Dactylonectria estremocensis]|uniref:Uncharacterized protein n=1 Tax=Dactylonectria estremocensis TaxID=1079267 RepID=A0A9P9E2H9_9HYPO|nr:hypothetical protein B0J13DRAFT_679227 [Dactylonectria estremocensis]